MTTGAPCPLHGAPHEGGETAWVETADGKRLRMAYWPAPEGMDGRDAVLLLQGRSEFIEKYVPVVREFRARGFAVGALDWRGQGLSERLLPEPRPGYVEDFEDFQQDLDAALGFMAAHGHMAPIGVAHSMGGCIAVERALRDPACFRGLVLTAPMLGLALASPVRVTARSVAATLSRTGLAARYVKTCDDRTAADWGFEDNVLTRDRACFDAFTGLLRDHPELGIGGATWGWLDAAFVAMRKVRDPKRGPLVTPTLIARADADAVVDNAAIDALAERSEAVTLLPLEGARHEPFIELPETRTALWAGIDAHLDRLLRPETA